MVQLVRPHLVSSHDHSQLLRTVNRAVIRIELNDIHPLNINAHTTTAILLQ